MPQLLWFMLGIVVGSVGFVAALLVVAAGAERRGDPVEQGQVVNLQHWRDAS